MATSNRHRPSGVHLKPDTREILRALVKEWNELNESDAPAVLDALAALTDRAPGLVMILDYMGGFGE